MTDRELMQQALEALNRSDYLGWQLNIPIIKALRERLAQEDDPIVGTKTWFNEEGKIVQQELKRSEVYKPAADRATELLKRCENEMRYAGWSKFEADNTARNGVYEQVKQYLEKNT